MGFETVGSDRDAGRISFKGGGLVKIFVRKVCEKKLFDANFVHFTLLKSQFQKSRGATPPLASSLAASLEAALWCK